MSDSGQMQSVGNGLSLRQRWQEELGEESKKQCHLRHQHCAMNTPLPPPLGQPGLGQPYTHIHIMHIIIWG